MKKFFSLSHPVSIKNFYAHSTVLAMRGDSQRGSLLIEILLAVTVGAIIIGAVSGLVYVSSKSGQNSGAKSSAISLAQEGIEAVQSISEADWHKIYLPPGGAGDPDADKGELKPYYLCKNGSFWILCSDTVCDVDVAADCNMGNIQIDDIIYARKIYIDNVDRKKTAERPICTEAENCSALEKVKDPSTQKIKAVVSKSGSADVALEVYLTRWKNETFSQSDWSTAEPVTQLDCQNANGTWDAASSQCYAAYPANKNNWSAYDSTPPDANIEVNNPPGSIKLRQ